jgi:uncharacterized membrane protein
MKKIINVVQFLSLFAIGYTPLFIIFKLTGVVNWSWLWVFMPLIIFVLICFFIFVVMFSFILKKGKGHKNEHSKK